MSHHDDELPTPKTPEEFRELAERKARFLEEAKALRTNTQPEPTMTPTPNPTPNDRPRPFADDLRPIDFRTVAERALARRP